MTPRALLKATTAAFRDAGIPDPEVDSAALLSHVTGKHPLELRLTDEGEIPPEQLSRFQALCKRRMARTPLQYLTQSQSFLGHPFHVDERVLIPRPETELLCERAIEVLKRLPSPGRALDLCCGSGCIAISMALAVPSARVDAVDLSRDALEVAAANAETLHADITVLYGDLFHAVGQQVYDVIVSNPPYIPAEDCKALQAEVLQEPIMALDGGQDGLDFYRSIVANAPSHLALGGTLLLEVGDGEADAVAHLLTEAGMTAVAVHPDLQGLPRMVEAHYGRG